MATKLKTPPKYQQVKQSLLARILGGEFPVGSRLPTIQEASRELNASYVTTQRAYRMLADDGILECITGAQGTRVIATESRPAQTRQLVLSGVFRALRQRNEVENFGLDMFESVCRSLGEKQVAMLHHRMGDDDQGAMDAVDRGLADVARGAAQGLVLDQIVPDEELRKVEAAGYPAVVLCRHPAAIAVDSVAPDLEWMGREVGRRAVAAGYQRVALCNVWKLERHNYPIGRARFHFYDAYVKGAMGSVFPRDDIVTYYEPPLAEGARADEDGEFMRWYGVPQAPGGPRTLFVLGSDIPALRILSLLRQRGFRVPDDAGVIGLLDAQCNRQADSPVTTWRIDPFEVGRETVQVLLDRLAFPERERTRRYLKPMFVDHGTL